MWCEGKELRPVKECPLLYRVKSTALWAYSKEPAVDRLPLPPSWGKWQLCRQQNHVHNNVCYLWKPSKARRSKHPRTKYDQAKFLIYLPFCRAHFSPACLYLPSKQIQAGIVSLKQGKRFTSLFAVIKSCPLVITSSRSVMHLKPMPSFQLLNANLPTSYGCLNLMSFHKYTMFLERVYTSRILPL